MIDCMQYNEASGVPSLSANTIEIIPINKTNKTENSTIKIA